MRFLVTEGVATTTRNSKLKDMTGWDIAVSKGHVEVFDSLCQLAQSKISSSELRYPNVNEEFKIQKLRRTECMNNREARQYGDRPTEVAAVDSTVDW